MSIFEMVFNLLGLVLGLSLVVVLGGLARTLKSRPVREVSWLTPLLGIWVILDVSAFWGLAWEVRDLLGSLWPSLLVGVTLASVYYLAAALVFPDNPEAEADLDAHFWRVKRPVIALVLICDIASFAIAQLLGRTPSPFVIAFDAVYFALALAAFFVRSRTANLALLGALTTMMAAGFLIP
jgi:hypothetical protein